MAIERASLTPVHYQWDPDSRRPLPDPGSAPDNCGPTSVENIAHFYRERAFGIYNTRRLAADPYGPTLLSQQRAMLEGRGVPCYMTVLSVDNLRNIIRGGKRPVLLALDFSRIPVEMAGHPFRGRHSVVALDTDGPNYVRIRDPNFNRTFRQDPTGGNRRYSNTVISASQIAAIVPFSSKVITTTGGGLLPDTGMESILRADGDDGMRFRTMRSGGSLPNRTLEKGKPIRKGIRVGDGRWLITEERRVIHPFGRIDVRDLPDSEKKYGDVLLVDVYVGNGSVIGYVKQADLAGN